MFIRQSDFECDYTLIGTVETVAEENKLKVFPNPASETIHVPFESEVVEAKIFDVTDRMVVQVWPRISDGNMSIDVRDLPTGLCHIGFRASSKIWGGKFVKGN